MNDIMQVSTDKITNRIGSKIRTLRQDSNLTISNLAERTGLTISMISQVERGLISPSIDSLNKICTSFNIDISDIFSDENASHEKLHPSATVEHSQHFDSVELHGSSPVVRKNDRKLLYPKKGIEFQLLNPNLNGPIEFIYNEYQPGVTTDFYSHPGSECGLILSGQLTIRILDKEYVLEEGDSITFNSTDKHQKLNASNEVCTCVWANVPPWF